MAAAGNVEVIASPANSDQLQVEDAKQVWGGALVALNSPQNATAAKRGRVLAFNDAAGMILLGRAEAPKLGNILASPIPTVPMNTNRRIERKTVVGATSREFIGSTVYATDDNTFTLTYAAPNHPVGIVWDWRTGSVNDVLFYSAEVLLALAHAGSHQKTLELPVTPAIAASAYLIGSAVTGLVLRGHGLITSHDLVCVRKPTDADVNYAVAPKINDVFVTGGSAVMLFSDTVGLVKAGTAITGVNEFHDGDLLQLYATETAAGTATDVGTYISQLNLRYLPGI